MTQVEAEVRALAQERDALEVENRALRAKLLSLSKRLEEATERLTHLHREVFKARGGA